MKAQLQYHSLPSHGFLPLCFIGFSPFTIELSSYSYGLLLKALRKFQPFVLNMGLQCIHHLWAFLFFIYHFFFFFSLNSPLARIYCSLRLKVHEVLIILGLFMQQGGPKLGKLILAL